VTGFVFSNVESTGSAIAVFEIKVQPNPVITTSIYATLRL
jgi:hypothetical protein